MSRHIDESADEDLLDRILDQWRSARPEIDADGMSIVPRIFRLATLYDAEMTPVSRGLGLRAGWLDVLSALRRVGPPYRLSAKEVARWALLSSGGLTSRIDRMQEAGLVTRAPDPEDRRGVLIELTQRGLEVVDQAIDAHLALYERLLESLTKTEQRTFIHLMRKQTASLERRRGDAGP